MLTIALVPVDGRPVTREMPVQLGALAGVAVRVPPAELLGFFKEPGDRAALREWLRRTAAESDALVVSGDMLAYGGLVPSRILPISAQEALDSMGVLRELRAEYPEKPIYLFNTVMRISNSNTDEEEPGYWAEYGTRIWNWSAESHRAALAGSDEAARAAADAAAAVPAEIREHYLSLRESRFEVNQALLNWVTDGTLDLVVFPQDDCAPYGFHTQERRVLMAAAASLGDQVLAYPGADEVAAALTARAVHALRQTQPRVFPIYSSGAGPRTRTMYEDIPLGETVAHHVRAAGGMLVSDPAAADLILAIHSPAESQGDWYLQERLAGSPIPVDEIRTFVAAVDEAVRAGRAVALADVAYANGADAALAEPLLAQVPVERLAAYSAWNTAGNTLGTAVAQGGLAWAVRKSADSASAAAHRRLQAAQATFLLTRFSDDYLYQACARPPYSQARTMTENQLLERVAAPLTASVRQLYAKHFGDYSLTLDPVTFPWHRGFEVRIGLELS